VGRHLVLRARQSLGLVLPALMVYAMGQDLASQVWPGWDSNDWAPPVEVAAMGMLLLVGSPLIARIAWPTRPLPPGPLRDRLEGLAHRLGFRCSDILVWDTGQNMANACVTGSLPWFRYVLLTDALIDSLDSHEIAAVFGHEIGHIAHRHLLYSGVFFAASLAILAIFGESIDAGLFALTSRFLGSGHPLLVTMLQASGMLLIAGLYVLIVLGHVSRRFERQADIFGCQAVSCGQRVCPPHLDDEHPPAAEAKPAGICPVGIHIFARALRNVALVNGTETRALSWRHGSIARRIAFLEELESRPEALGRFEADVSRLRLIMTVGLLAAAAVALAADPAGFFR
jgi:STE24 endopeptidase